MTLADNEESHRCENGMLPLQKEGGCLSGNEDMKIHKRDEL